ncbi:hypothetical protein AAFF_G00129330 [Aldrovandia affinis]|uniref:Uncharacterized protein n=1 Tax=Aldrovandia affinis TaxID=143900 RepID=A0AAD7T2H8_9TELE|nr:hypothetical protein AAFF_G00129330 [Aldrovandia affinis]
MLMGQGLGAGEGAALSIRRRVLSLGGSLALMAAGNVDHFPGSSRLPCSDSRQRILCASINAGRVHSQLPVTCWRLPAWHPPIQMQTQTRKQPHLWSCIKAESRHRAWV